MKQLANRMITTIFKKKTHLTILATCIFGVSTVFGQQKIKVEVYPTVSQSIKGVKNLERKKYFNLAARSSEMAKSVNQERFKTYIEEYEMTLGRRLGVVNPQTRWAKTVIEDVNRPGYADLEYLQNKTNSNDFGLTKYVSVFGDNEGIAAHDNRDTYPDFMEKYEKEDAHGHKFPVNNDAAAELSANVLKYSYTDFQRPAFYELVNEPHWRYWGDDKFAELHTLTKQKVRALGLATLVGGPCYSVSNFYNKEFGSLNQITQFIDKTNFQLDFYSFHSYDYMHWNADKEEFYGGINSGLPLDAVFDALGSYTFNKYGKELKYVASEHGGYLPDGEERTKAFDALAAKYFSGSGFLHEMEKRTIDNFIMVNSAIANTMTFMDHPHVVLKSVPFILLESAGWDPTYYSSLLVKENFNKSSSTWHEARLIDFFRYFKGVKGRRIRSNINDTDIQHHAFVDGNTVILLFHNQSNVEGEIEVALNQLENTITKQTVRRLSTTTGLRPSFEEMEVTDITNLSIGAQESIVVFVETDQDIEEKEVLDIIPFYSDQTAVNVNGSKDFIVNIADHKKANYAALRVGISRDASKGKGVEISLNGTKLDVPIEDCAERITDNMYATTKVVYIKPSLIKERNTVNVKFTDGLSGGVGAVVLRAAMGEKDFVDLDPDTVVSNINAPKLVDSLVLYPNPAKGTVSVSSVDAGTIQLLDITGRVLLQTNILAGKEAELSIENIQAGTYFVRLKGSSNLKTSKLVVQ